MELLRITRHIHCKAVEQRATLIHRQYNRDWGTSYSRPPIDPSTSLPPCYKILAAPLYTAVVRICFRPDPVLPPGEWVRVYTPRRQIRAAHVESRQVYAFIVLPSRWRRKPAGIDMERNYVTVILCTEHSTGVPAANAIVTGSEDAVSAVVPADDLSHPAENHVLDQCEHRRYLVREPATAPIWFNAAGIPNDGTILTTTHTTPV